MKNWKNTINKTASTLATFMVVSAALALPAISSATANTNTPTPLWTLNNFDQPESVVSDTRGQHLYVSNINGQPTELNGKGYISKLDVNGTVIKQQWLTGFDAPKGMAIKGDTLYVADMQQVHVVSLSKGKIVKHYQAPNAKMLNDITIGDDGSVYISDLLGGGIYQIKHNKMAMWFNPTQLPHPNGLLWQDDSLLVASWGLGMNNDFTTKTPGSIYKVNINADTSALSLVPVAGAQKMGNLDGLTSNGDDLYVSDWINGNLFKVSGNKREKVLSLKPGLADISSHKGLLFAPMMMDGVVRAWKI
jgi:DNA-binding beta-propeller fold protein YncE